MNVVHQAAPRVPRDVLRERALTAARAIVCAEGLRALTARRVTQDIGVALGTLYNLFENFDALILQLNLETLHLLGRAIDAEAPPTGDAERSVLGLARRYLDFTLAHRNEWAAVLEFAPSVMAYQAEFDAAIGGMIARVEQALAPLFPAPQDPGRRLAAAVLWTSIEGIGGLAASRNLALVADATPWEMAQSLIVNYLRGAMQPRRACAVRGAGAMIMPEEHSRDRPSRDEEV